MSTIANADATFTFNQAGVACSDAISPTSNTVSSSGGTGSVSVTAPGSCSWSAVANNSWITVTSGASGTGNGSVSYTVAANPTGLTREGTITIAEQIFAVSQAGVTCSYSINPTSESFTSSAASDSVMVTAPGGCAWTTASNDPWLTITSGASGTGNGTVTYSVLANDASSVTRNGTLTIAGHTLAISQTGVSCSTQISPTSKSFTSNGGIGTVTVATPSGCSWTASTSDSWLSITSGTSGSGGGTVTYSVSSNASTSASRSGSLTIGGQTLSISQSGAACSYVLSPTSASYPATGGSGSVSVTGPTGCSWTASTTNSWITIQNGSSGNGNGTVSYDVAANSAPSGRSGNLTIAGAAFSVSQSSADPVCGDGVKNGSDVCDGTDFGTLTDCKDLGFAGGLLVCDPSTCTIDNSNCYDCTMPTIPSGLNPDYVVLGDGGSVVRINLPSRIHSSRSFSYCEWYPW